jgi:hypothetical protein
MMVDESEHVHEFHLRYVCDCGEPASGQRYGMTVPTRRYEQEMAEHRDGPDE